MPRDNPVNPANETRRLHRVRVAAGGSRPRIETVQLVSATDYQNAALIRSADGTELLRLSGPDSVLMTYRTGLGADATTVVARLDAEGQAHWTTDTGIGRLDQVLPDAQTLAVIGTRPPIPGKVSEPILVLVNTSTGTMTTHSLWR